MGVDGDGTQEVSRVAGDDGIRRHGAGDDAAGADDGVLADNHVRQDRRPRPDRRAPLHHRRLDLPVLLGLELPRQCRRPRIAVIDEGDAMADEDVILDGDALTDEGVTLDLAAPAHLRIPLDLDERADLRLVADLASVQVDEARELDILAERDVGRDAEVFAHWAPFPEMTAAGVSRRILTSVQRERVLAYRRSRRTISSNVVRLRPATCQSPVTPGLASRARRRCQDSYCSSSYGSAGRGPTSDMSPRSTFQSWGSSSRLGRRRMCPTGGPP